MNKSFRLSVSQMKKLNKSIAMWAGLYILEIKETFDNTNTIVWSMFHIWIETWSEDAALQYLNKYMLDQSDRIKILEQFSNLQEHYSYYEDVEDWTHEEVFEYEYLWFPFFAKIDFINRQRTKMKDRKSVSKFADPDTQRPNHWSDLTTYQEYELQAWQYMIASWIKEMHFIEFLKWADVYIKVPKNKQKTHKAWDRKIPPEDSHNIIVFKRSDDWDKTMWDYWNPKLMEAKEVWDKYKPLVQNVE